METKLKKCYAVITGLFMCLIMAIILFVFAFIDNKSFIDDINAKKLEIIKRDSIIQSYKIKNDSIDKILIKYEHKIDSFSHIKIIILNRPTKQTSKNVEEAYKEMIKELNKYKLEINETNQ